MKIALDAQQLFEKEKTGVAWNARKIIECLTDDNSNEYILNYSWRRELVDEKEQVDYYRKKGCVVRKCGFLKTVFCKVIGKLHPIPYSWIFRDRVDITQFFNFIIPEGVLGKTVTIVHDMACKAYPETLSKKNKAWLDKNLSRSCQDATIIVTVSQFSKNEIVEYLHIPESKVKVIYSGIDHDKYHPGYSKEDVVHVKNKFGINGDYFLYLGTLEPRKNIVEIIDAYGELVQKLQKQEKCPQLVLAGRKGWLYESIFDKIKQLKLEGKVIFTGYIDDDDKVRLLCGAVAFIFPSLYEGFGTPPLEAMACGVPVIVSNCASLPEVVGDAGIKVPIKAPEEMTKAMELLIHDKTLWEEKRVLGLRQSKEFSWKKTVNLLKKVYTELV